MLLGYTATGPIYVLDRPARMLVVDDDPIMREFALSQLSMPGGTIVLAVDGEDAWEKLDAAPAAFDLVLCDLEMPRLNGFGLLDRIRLDPRTAQLPVVVITSREDMFAIDRAFEVGATSFVTKPVNWRLLGYQLRYVLRGHRLEAEARAASEVASRAAVAQQNLLTLLQHETRTPLNGIVGYAEILRASLGEPARAAESAETVVVAARQLGEVLQRVFRYAQLSSRSILLDLEPMPLADAVEEAVRPAQARAAAAEVTLAVEAMNGRGALIACDLPELVSALGEVLANALAHAPPRSKVTIVPAVEDGNAVVTVRDEGPGIALDLIERCAEPFGQSMSPLIRTGKGLGLGLPIAQRVAELHGGQLTLRSGPAGGTIVRMTLPLVGGAKPGVAG